MMRRRRRHHDHQTALPIPHQHPCSD